MEHKPPARLPALKLIAFALMFSTLAYAGFAAGLLATGSAPTPSNTRMFTLLILVTGGAIIPSALAFGPIFAGAARSQWPRHRDDPRAGDWLLNQFSTLTITRIAMVESVGVLGATGLLLTGRWAFIAAPILSVAIMALFFPTEAKARAFITNVTGQVPQ